MTQISDVVVPRMQALQRLEKSFKRLNLSWKVIETTARVVSPAETAGFIGTLEHTRAAFSQLALEMVEQIGATCLANCQRDLESRAQVAIDILVRNLFERTADVGFIATDKPLVDFVLEPDVAAATALHSRLQEYRAKYTVYQDIQVLDRQGNVLLGLQDSASRAVPAPTWWHQMLGTPAYVERYGASAYLPGTSQALIYAHQICAPEGAVCGAVLLQFDLPSEMASIFHALQDRGQRITLLILDAGQRVVACSDNSRFAAGEKMELPEPAPGSDQVPVLRIHGVDYLFAHRTTRGYQGYGGPGWTGLALVAMDDAFAANSAAPPQNEDAESDFGVQADNPQLQSIIARAREIEKGLNRVIWNGKLADAGVDSGASMHPVFAEIGRTSKQTLALFDSAISELRTLVMMGRRAEMAAHASLAVNILDRNLYERANDCRWWALSDELARLLQALAQEDSEALRAQAQAVLAHLNSLYTVYRRIALFDSNGVVKAVSRDAASLPSPLQLPAALVAQTLALRGTQAYAVSEMQPNALADGAATYLYCAPVRIAGQQQPVGGIALAFNCADELQAMLRDALPVGSESIGLFLDPQGRVLSSTSAELAVGEPASFAAPLLALQSDGDCTFVQWQQQNWLAGLACSRGYREFKVSDGYRDDVRSVLLTPLRQDDSVLATVQLPQKPPRNVADTHFYGVVQCGSLYLGLSGRDVVEAIDGSAIAPPPAGSTLAGVYPHTVAGRMAILAVYDVGALLGQPALPRGGESVAVIVRAGNSLIVLLVARLVDVIPCDTLDPPPGGHSPATPWISGLIHDASPHTLPVLALNPAGILAGAAS